VGARPREWGVRKGLKSLNPAGGGGGHDKVRVGRRRGRLHTECVPTIGEVRQKDRTPIGKSPRLHLPLENFMELRKKSRALGTSRKVVTGEAARFINRFSKPRKKRIKEIKVTKIGERT